MTAHVRVGTRYHVIPIQPIEANTTWIDAGTLRIGVEYRILNDDIVDATFTAANDATAEVHAARPETLDDRGVSLHVCEAATGDEYLRFDLFDEEPHYHYIAPGEWNDVVQFDVAAFGDPLEWALGCLRTRVPEMLTSAGAPSLAERIDTAALYNAVAEVERTARNCG